MTIDVVVREGAAPTGARWTKTLGTLTRIVLLLAVCFVSYALAALQLHQHEQLASGEQATARVLAKDVEKTGGMPYWTITLRFNTSAGEHVEAIRPVGAHLYYSVAVGDEVGVLFARDMPRLPHVGAYRFDTAGFALTVAVLCLSAVSVVILLIGLFAPQAVADPQSRAFRWCMALRRLTSALIVLAILVFATMMLSLHAERDRRLGAPDVRTTEATVVDTWRERDLTGAQEWAVYTFTDAAGTRHLGYAGTPAGAPLAAGATISIVHDAAQPRFNAAAPYQPATGTLVILIAVILGCLMMLAWQLWQLFRPAHAAVREVERAPFIEPQFESGPLPRFLHDVPRDWVELQRGMLGGAR